MAEKIKFTSHTSLTTEGFMHSFKIYLSLIYIHLNNSTVKGFMYLFKIYLSLTNIQFNKAYHQKSSMCTRSRTTQCLVMCTWAHQTNGNERLQQMGRMLQSRFSGVGEKGTDWKPVFKANEQPSKPKQQKLENNAPYFLNLKLISGPGHLYWNSG